ncbi:hypothetical protein TRIATDRAFT_297914 [Trichoderma atroviride IMI 206040]|uniref:Uncharacterized protein n=1 Tax=Hypocrea atroviridis (strain ATCC 20476 / IMI 206040) TaxID=452589 RepID=G9NK64_HYPAI|nr:uncharacterized protein TRIATDRAFT_297914 [Trichoderma atroviride IMI 206040]EHK49283.1 hypothetical protein TRIATDRAFT_297914 [Trichoderma atroviride IMI 206040]
MEMASWPAWSEHHLRKGGLTQQSFHPRSFDAPPTTARTRAKPASNDWILETWEQHKASRWRRGRLRDPMMLPTTIFANCGFATPWQLSRPSAEQRHLCMLVLCTIRAADHGGDDGGWSSAAKLPTALQQAIQGLSAWAVCTVVYMRQNSEHGSSNRLDGRSSKHQHQNTKLPWRQ